MFYEYPRTGKSLKEGIKRASFWHAGSCHDYEDKLRGSWTASACVFTSVSGEMVLHSLQDLAGLLKIMWFQSWKWRIKFESLTTLGELPVICLKITVDGGRMAPLNSRMLPFTRKYSADAAFIPLFCGVVLLGRHLHAWRGNLSWKCLVNRLNSQESQRNQSPICNNL